MSAPEPRSLPLGSPTGLRATLLRVGVLRIALAIGLLWWLGLTGPLNPDPGHFFYHGAAQVEGPVGELCVKWDSYWYLQIVREGYDATAEGQQNLAFFPCYPMSIKAVAALGVPPVYAGVGISLACFVLALLAAWSYAEQRFGPGAGSATLLWLCVFPSSWVFSMVYAEALFCALVFGFLALYHRERYDWAAAVAVFVPLTRGAGLALGAAIGVDFLVRWLRTRQLPRGPLLAGAGFGLGLAGLCAFYTSVTGSPLGFLGQQTSWAEDLGTAESVSRMLAGLLRLQEPDAPVALAFWAVMLAALAALWRRARDIDTWYATGAVLLLIFFGLHRSQLRYMLPLLPLHALLACFLSRRGWLGIALVVIAPLQLVLTHLWMRWQIPY